MPLNTESKFASRRTFIIKVHRDSKPGFLSGRLESYVTGRQHDFASSDELIASILHELEFNEADLQSPPHR
jgi:hypothetical protein